MPSKPCKRKKRMTCPCGQPAEYTCDGVGVCWVCHCKREYGEDWERQYRIRYKLQEKAKE